MQVAGVAGEKHPAPRIAVGDQPMGHPKIGVDNFDGEIGQAGAAADQIDGVECRRIDVELGRP